MFSKISGKMLAAFSCALLIIISSNAMAAELIIRVQGISLKAPLQDVTAKFSKNHGVKISVLTEGEKKSTNEDILIWRHDRLGELIDENSIRPVKLNSTVLKHLHPAAAKAARYKSRFWGYPIGLETYALLVNRDLVSKAPHTMQDLTPIAASLRDNNVTALGFDMTNFYYAYSLINAYKGYIFGGSYARPNVTDVGLTKYKSYFGLDEVIKLQAAGIITKNVNYQEQMRRFRTGKLAMVVTGPWEFNSLAKSELKLGMAPIPMVGKDKFPKPLIGVNMAMIKTTTKDPQLAEDFMKSVFMDVKTLVALQNKGYFGIPAHKGVLPASDKRNKEIQLMQQLYPILEKGELVPAAAAMKFVWKETERALKALSKGKVGAKTAMYTATRHIKNAVKTKYKQSNK